MRDQAVMESRHTFLMSRIMHVKRYKNNCIHDVMITSSVKASWQLSGPLMWLVSRPIGQAVKVVDWVLAGAGGSVTSGGIGQWWWTMAIVDSGARSGGGPGSRRRGVPIISSDNRKTSILAPITGVFCAVYEPKCICVRVSAPTQPGSSYYYLLTRPGSGIPHWLLTGVLMSNVLTQNFGRMSFGGPFPAGGPTHVLTVLTDSSGPWDRCVSVFSVTTFDRGHWPVFQPLCVISVHTRNS